MKTRHFPYKHPTFGTDKNPKPKSAWENSVYYWWFEYLKRNEDYLECCENGGEGKLANLYKDFGDIRTITFKKWWMEDQRGAELFADPSPEDTVRTLNEGERVLSKSEALTISFPINLPKNLLEKRFKQILDIEHKGKRGVQLAKKSRAKYRFNGQPNIEGLRVALQVYDFKKANPDMRLFDIGNALPRFQLQQKFVHGETYSEREDKKNILSATVGRYLKRVADRIENVAKGKFP
jgi:hypothetical protein